MSALVFLLSASSEHTGKHPGPYCPGGRRSQDAPKALGEREIFTPHHKPPPSFPGIADLLEPDWLNGVVFREAEGGKKTTQNRSVIVRGSRTV
ncbi:transcription factor 7-like 1-B [Clarias magur]|uniref:Transcription factor 7-like 1-B n=1 Tax=Clarias magur TaxID=1594786 RepID=A0A8J4TZC9_CLAMG|nr:transcription factor 7-like 1-B [Clarias magur]